MNAEQSTPQSTQTTNQTEPQNHDKEYPGVVTIPIDVLVRKGKEDIADAVDTLVSMLTDFFKFSGITNYMVIKFTLDAPTAPFDILVTVPNSEDDIDYEIPDLNAEKEIKQLIYEYLAKEKKPLQFSMEGFYADAAVESIIEYAKAHGYNGILAIGKGSDIKNPKDYEFQAILLKCN